MSFSSFSFLLPAFIFTFSAFLFLSSAAHHHHHRHLLHQPYSPLDSLSRTTTQSIDPSFPSSPPPPDFPFFPETTIPPPPPPPPPPFASFPANISALTLPQEHKSSKGASSKLIAGAFAAVVAAIILVSVSTFLHFRKRRNREFVDSKSNRFEDRSRLHRNNSVNLSTGAIPIIERPLKLSSEFLYLGTLVDSHGSFDNSVAHTDSLSNSSTAPAGNSISNLGRIGSPELRPLPPLKGKKFGLNHRNSELCSCSEDEYDNDDLYSLKWSGMGRNNSIGTDSAVEMGKIVRECSCSSFSSSSSASRSPLRSTSLSVSPPVSLSPERSTVKPPEIVSVNLIPPPLPIPPPVIPSGSLVNQKESPSPSPSHFPSVPSLASPARVDIRSRDSSPRISNFSDHGLDSPLKISSPDHQNVHFYVPSFPPRSPSHPASVHLPPSRPPPPPPPPLPLCSKHCEIPKTPPQEDNGFMFDPPVFATPVRPLSVENHTFHSTTQLHSYSKDTQNNDRIIDLHEKTNDNGEKNMENPYVKMEPLHWDKVTVNSGGEMMSDQLNSSSFKFENVA